MKRAMYEWGAISCASFSAVLIAHFAVSLATDRGAFELSFGESRQTRMQVVVENGQITLCENTGNLELIDLASRSVPMSPPVVSNLGWTSPVFGVRYISFPDGFFTWRINMSTILLALLFAAVAFLCQRRYRSITMNRVENPQTA